MDFFDFQVAAFDLDGTLLTGNSSFSFCIYLYKSKVLSLKKFLYIVCLYISHLFFGLSLLSLHRRAFQRLFCGRPIFMLDRYLSSFIQTLQWYSPALDRLNELKSKGLDVYIFSNSPIFLVEAIAAKIGITADKVIATDYNVDRFGCLKDINNFVDGKRKGEILKSFKKNSIAFSDSHHDILFLKAASKAVAVKPTYKLLRASIKNCWEIL